MKGQWTKDSNGSWVYNYFWDGFSARHYLLEHMFHKDLYAHQYSQNVEAEKIIKKIRRHFKLDFSYEFTQNSNGHALSYSKYIKLPKKNVSLGMICHEIAHLLAFKKWGDRVKHNRKFQTQCNRVCKWARRYLPQPKTS